MNIQIDGHHTVITEALRQSIEAGAQNLSHCFHKIGKIHVSLTVEEGRKNNHHIAEIDVHFPKKNICAKSESNDMYQSIHQAFSKVERQGLKIKEKRKAKMR